MKNLTFLLILVILGACSAPENKSEDHSGHEGHAAASSEKPKSKSPAKMAMTNVGKNHVHIEYHSPSKRGRQIFGGLVAYGEVWVTGAHNATSIRFSKDVEIGGTQIPIGKYALFTIPGEEEWTVIINKNWEQHLADDYDQAEDVVRFQVTPKKLDQPMESLTYLVELVDEATGTITISWDDVAISFEVKNS
ncbi:MAG: DUF2911 domain-containing protein [Cytophagales bacterium]|nr:DUF2911 domain-containing protein [Cytophagales bacterium]